MRTLFMLTFLLLAATAQATLPCTSLPFGAANHHNLFVLGNLDHRNSDTEGRVAVGGDATFSHYSLGKKVNLTDHGPLRVLNVGGRLNFWDGTLWNGLIGYGVSYRYVRAGFARSFSPPGSIEPVQITDPYDPTDHPDYYTYKSRDVDFVGAARHLRGLGQLWRGMASNAPYTKGPGEIVIQGVDSRLNVFELPAAALSATSHLVVEAPPDSTILVNVTGDEVVLKEFGFTFRGGIVPQNVVFNFSGVKKLQMSAIGAKGVFLAPDAEVNFTNGRLDGLLVAGAFFGDGQMNVGSFAGCLPSLPDSVDP